LTEYVQTAPNPSNMASIAWRNFADQCEEVFQACKTLEAFEPAPPHQSSQPLEVSPDITVQFPSLSETLSRLEWLALQTRPKIALIQQRYREACHSLQHRAIRQYQTFCCSAKSVEQFGGTSDYEIQRQVARGIAGWYEASEAKLANIILARFKPTSESLQDHGALGHAEKVHLLISPHTTDLTLFSPYHSLTQKTSSAAPSPPTHPPLTPNETTSPAKPA
jgi:hypothetical protein